MKLVVHQGIPDDVSLRTGWNDCVQQMERPEIFYTYEWSLAVAISYSNSIRPLLILAYDGDTVIGVAALATSHYVRQTFFLTAATGDYCDLICHSDRRAEFVDNVFSELQRLKTPELVLANLPADSATVRVLADAARKWGYYVFSRPAYVCAQIELGSEEQRKAARRSAQRHIKRFAKAITGSVPVRVEHARTWKDIARILPELECTHIARFLEKGLTSNLESRERRAFLEELARLLSSSGSIVISRLILGDQAIAWNYGFQFGKSWSWYQATFDSEFKECSPGLWLFSGLIEEASCSRNIDRIDLGLGDASFKNRLATGYRYTVHITASISAFRNVAVRFRYRAATVVKSMPKIEQMIRRFGTNSRAEPPTSAAA